MVDKSLSRGLADRVLEEMKSLGSLYLEACAAAVRRIPRKRHTVREFAEGLQAAGESCSLTQVVGSHSKWRWAAICAFMPEIEVADGSDQNRAIAFHAVRHYVHVDRVPQGHSEQAPILVVREHAVERLFQRLNVMDAAEVREEIHDAMLLAIPLLAACERLGFKQVALPTQSGAFLCCIDSTNHRLTAKTWIGRSEEGGRHTPVIEAIEAYYDSSGGAPEVGLMLSSAPMDIFLNAIEAPADLVDALQRFTSLQSPYERRADPVGDAWRQARQHAQADPPIASQAQA